MSLITDYLQQLKNLLPRGELWTGLMSDPVFNAYLESEAAEKARIHARALNVIEETDPRTIYELLPEYEGFAGLPEKCVGELGTLEQRRKNLQAKLTMKGGQSKAYFKGLAQSYGFDISITEFEEFSVNSTVNDALNGEDWAYTWQINAPAETVNYFTAESDVSTPLAYWGNELLECVISRYKPAHTIVLFSYGA